MEEIAGNGALGIAVVILVAWICVWYLVEFVDWSEDL